MGARKQRAKYETESQSATLVDNANKLLAIKYITQSHCSYMLAYFFGVIGG